MHEHMNNRVRSVRNRVVNRRESGGLWLWLRRERDGGVRLRLVACSTQISGDGRVPGRPSRACPRIGSPRIERPFLGPVSLFNARGGVQSLRS